MHPERPSSRQVAGKPRRRLGVVVPGLEISGGVSTVADFVTTAVRESPDWELVLVSLAMSSVDADSTVLRSPSGWNRGVRARSGEWRGIPFVHVGASWADFEFQRYRSRDLLRDVLRGCSVIQVVAGTAAWATSVLDLGIPVSLQLATRTRVERRWRDANARGVLGHWRKAMTTVADRLDDRALTRVDAIQVENPWMLDYAREINRHRSIDIRFAPPGIDAQYFSPQSGPLGTTEPYVLAVGRFADPRKRVGLLVDALHRLRNDGHREVRLVLAGKSAPDDAVWRHAQELGVRDSIEFVSTPGASELVDLYRNATALALSSDEEGLGMVVLEAMACGTPVVATKCGGPDGVITDGEDGFLVPRGDAGAIADRLGILLEDPSRRGEMGRAARLTIDARFDRRRAAVPFLEVWQQLSRESEPGQ